MTSVLLIILLSFLTPLTVSFIFLSLIIPEPYFFLNWRFSVVRFVRALFVAPFALFFAYQSYFLLIFLLLNIIQTLAPSLFFSFFRHLLFSSVVVVFSKTATKLYTAFFLLRHRYTTFTPFLIQQDVKQAFNSVFKSFQFFLEKADFLQILQNVNPPTEFPDDIQHAFSYLNQMRRNLTITPETQKHIDPINTAVNRFLSIVQVENVFNTTRLPPEFNASLHNVTDEMHRLANHFNITLLLKGDIIPDNPLLRIGKSLQTTMQSADMKKTYEATVLLPASELNIDSSEKSVLLSLLKDPSDFISSDETPVKLLLLRTALPIHIALAKQYVLFFILVSCVIFPLIFMLQVVLQEGWLWQFTRRYKFVIPHTERSTSGWMSVAVISSLAMVITKAFPFCCVFYYLLFSNMYSNVPIRSFLIFFALKGAPLRTASHMRLAEGVAENDVLKERDSGPWKGLFVGGLFNGMFLAWWLLSTAIFWFSPWSGAVFWAAILVDIVIIGCSIAWGERIFRRVVEKEQRWREVQQRKQD